jgi:hypothetical protein
MSLQILQKETTTLMKIYKGKEKHQTLISSNDNRFPFNFFSRSKNKIIIKN